MVKRLAADCCHVYGVTRRGYGASSVPETGYDEPSLSNDVWTVIQTLGLKAPVLIGHSMAGTELTGVGMLHSDRLGGLVYLDALGDATDDPPDDPTWKVDAINPAYYTVANGDGHTKAACEADIDVGGDPGPAADCRWHRAL